MTTLNQLVSFEQMVKFGKQRFIIDVLPVAERAQSDRAISFIGKVTERFSGGILVQHMPKWGEAETASEKLLMVCEALVKTGTEIRIDLAIQVGQQNAHKRYSDVNKDSIDNLFNVFEWMLALVTFDRFRVTQRSRYLAALSHRKNAGKIQRLAASVESVERKIQNIEQVIENNTRYLAEWKEKLNRVNNEMNSLIDEDKQEE